MRCTLLADLHMHMNLVWWWPALCQYGRIHCRLLAVVHFGDCCLRSLFQMAGPMWLSLFNCLLATGRKWDNAFVPRKRGQNTLCLACAYACARVDSLLLLLHYKSLHHSLSLFVSSNPFSVLIKHPASETKASKKMSQSPLNSLYSSRWATSPEDARVHQEVHSGPRLLMPPSNTSIEQGHDVVPTTSQVTKKQQKTPLTDLPVEILRKILESLLLHPHAIFLPTLLLDDCSDLQPKNPSLFPSVLSTCRLLHDIGTPILYGQNIFDLRAHSRLPTWSPTRGLTMIQPSTMRHVSQIQVEIEPMNEHHLPAITGIGTYKLDYAMEWYPGNILDVQAIRCVVDASVEAQAEIMFWIGTPPSRESQPEWTRFWTTVRDTLFKWQALLVARSINRHRTGFTHMYRVGWVDGLEVNKGIWVRRNNKNAWPAWRANTMRGVYLLAELEVDVGKEMVKEISGKRPGYCF